MNIDHHFIHDVLIVDLPEGEGRLSGIDIDEFTSDLIKLCGPSAKKIAFNMSRKSFLTSSGLGDLVKLKDCLLDRELELVLISPSQRVKSLLDMVGVDQFFNVIDSEDQL
ncbi:MAG: STAS domain-containing protein [Spirochaetes bacterium]|nr:STAS domain-containing protein [Spirochaetota bacterium]